MRIMKSERAYDNNELKFITKDVAKMALEFVE